MTTAHLGQRAKLLCETPGFPRSRKPIEIVAIFAVAGRSRPFGGGVSYYRRMKTIIGEYDSLAAATRAVRSLESTMSIQGIVITDQSPFVVSMFGRAADIERARALLSSTAAR